MTLNPNGSLRSLGSTRPEPRQPKCYWPQASQPSGTDESDSKRIRPLVDPICHSLVTKAEPGDVATRVISPFSINSFASASVCARLETRSSSRVTGLFSGSAIVLPHLIILSARHGGQDLLSSCDPNLFLRFSQNREI